MRGFRPFSLCSPVFWFFLRKGTIAAVCSTTAADGSDASVLGHNTAAATAGEDVTKCCGVMLMYVCQFERSNAIRYGTFFLCAE